MPLCCSSPHSVGIEFTVGRQIDSCFAAPNLPSPNDCVKNRLMPGDELTRGFWCASPWSALISGACRKSARLHEWQVFWRVVRLERPLRGRILGSPERRHHKSRANFFAESQCPQPYSFVRRLPWGESEWGLDAAGWAGVGQGAMEETAGAPAMVSVAELLWRLERSHSWWW